MNIGDLVDLLENDNRAKEDIDVYIEDGIREDGSPNLRELKTIYIFAGEMLVLSSKHPQPVLVLAPPDAF